MPTIREQIANQQQNLEDALVTSGMPRPAAVIFAKHLTRFVAVAEISDRRISGIEATKAERQRMRNGEITLQEYNDFKDNNRITERGVMMPDGTIVFTP